MRRVHKKGTKVYRPLMGEPFKKAMLLIADALNETALMEFDDLAVGRHAVYELWKRVFPGKPFPPEADILRTPYHKDPGV